MADRTGCHLTIGGLLSDQNAWSLGQVLCAERPYNLEGPLSEKAIYQSILKGRSSWDFEEVDEGRMSSDLQVCLQNLCISYTWTWNWGDDFAPGILLFDARTRKQARFFESEGEICLKACELSDQNRIVEAQSWQEFRQHLRVVTYSSQHELVALLSDQHTLAPMQISLSRSVAYRCRNNFSGTKFLTQLSPQYCGQLFLRMEVLHGRSLLLLPKTWWHP